MADLILDINQSLPAGIDFQYVNLRQAIHALLQAAVITNSEGAPVEVDEITNALAVISTVHHEIHEGEFYTSSLFNDNVVDDAAIMIHLLTDNTRFPHMTFTASCGGNARVELLEAPNVANNGVAIAERSNNRSRLISARVQAFSNPTIAGGDALLDALLAGGTGGNSSGGLERLDTEFLLARGASYVIRVTNIAGNAQPASIVVGWYEEDNN